MYVYIPPYGGLTALVARDWTTALLTLFALWWATLMSGMLLGVHLQMWTARHRRLHGRP